MATPAATAPLNVAQASLAQLQQYANAQAAANAKASEAPIVSEEQAQQASDAAHGKAIQGFATALASLLQNAAPAIQNAYTGAANSQATYGKGFSTALQNIVNQSQGQTNSFLSQMGAPASATPPAPNVGDVTYGLGGYIPASTLGREGAAWTAAANMLPANAANQGQQDLQANNYADQDAVAKLQDQVATIAGKVPGQAQTALTGLEGLQTKQQANDLTQEKITQAAQKEADANTKTTIGYLLKQTTVDPKTGMVTMSAAVKSQLGKLLGVPPSSITGVDASTMAGIVQNQINNGFKQQTLAQGDKRIAIAQQNANTSATRANNAVAPKYSASVSRSLGYRSDQYGNALGGKVKLLPGFSFAANGDIVKAKSGSSSTKVHGFTPAETAKMQGTALTLAQNAEQGFTDTKGVQHPPLDYNGAVLEAQKEGLPAWVYIPAFNQFYKDPSQNPYAMGPANPKAK